MPGLLISESERRNSRLLVSPRIPFGCLHPSLDFADQLLPFPWPQVESGWKSDHYRRTTSEKYLEEEPLVPASDTDHDVTEGAMRYPRLVWVCGFSMKMTEALIHHYNRKKRYKWRQVNSFAPLFQQRALTLCNGLVAVQLA